MILKKIKTAIEDYGELPEVVERATLAALTQLGDDLEAAGYEQSSKSDTAEGALEQAMNEHDSVEKDEQEV